MNNINYLSGWNPELCIQLKTENKNNADFNRFLVKGFPSTLSMQKGNAFENANREAYVLRLKDTFQELIEKGDSATALYGSFTKTHQYLKWCDDNNHESFTRLSLEGYANYLYQKVLLGNLKKSTYMVHRSFLYIIFTRYLELPYSWFDSVIVIRRDDAEPFEAYSKHDLNLLLPFLRRLFNQTYDQFIEEPERHIKAHKYPPTMKFIWKSQTYPISGGITKMMCAATYLLSYYTYANTTDLFQLKQPIAASTNLNDSWYTMKAFKRRSFKCIQVEMGGHKILEVPKYSISFFDKLLNASRIICNDENALLLQTVASYKVQSLKSVTLCGFLNLWLEKHFNFVDQTGRRLRPMVSRFRETGSQITSYYQGDIVNDIMLNNQPSTRKKHYSTGNKHTNNGMLQDTMSIREVQAKHKVKAKEAQKKLGIDVLVIEQEYKSNIPNLSRTPNGGSCASPFGERSEKYTRKALNRQFIKKGEKLACADLLNCFGCNEQVIVQSVSDIWCLLSFKSCIEESLYLHLDATHFRNNFEEVIRFIEKKILPAIKLSILKQAEAKLANDGLHPIWDDSDSILALLPRYVAKDKR